MKAGLISQILEYYFSPEQELLWGGTIEQAMNEFFMGELPEDIDETTEGHVIEWFLFDFHVPGGLTPFAYVCKHNPLHFSENDLKTCRMIRDSQIFDVFKITAVRPGKGMTLRHARTGDEYQVVEKTASKQLEPELGLIARVYKTGRFYELAGGSVTPLPPNDDKIIHKLTTSISQEEMTPQVIYWELWSPAMDLLSSAIIQHVADEDNETLVTAGNPAHEEDDCPVCQLMKRCNEEGRDPTKAELTEAMRQANEQHENGE